MSTLSVTIDGWDDFLADIRNAGIQADPLIRAALSNSATRVQSNVRGRAPHRTGALQRSVLISPITSSAVEVSVNEKYGIFVEEGTAAHIIEPSGKKALYWKGALNPYKSVRHPGTKANPFFSTGVNQSDSYIMDQFTKVMERIITVMAGH